MNRERMIGSLQAMALVAVIYVAVVASLMLILHRQLNQVNPLKFKELDLWKKSLKKDGKNQKLRKRVRQMYLLSHRAWFGGREKLRLGAWLLAGGMVFLFLTLGGSQLLKRKIPLPPEPVKERSPSMEVTALAILSAISVVGGLVGFLTLAHFQKKSPSLKKNPLTKSPLPEQVFSPEDFQENWPNFRGPSASGLATGHKLVLGWDGPSGKGVVWKKKSPLPGHSSPIVWGKYLIITGGNKSERAIFCYQANSGKLLWKFNTKSMIPSSTKLPQVSPDTGFSASTPTTDGHRIFAIFATGNLICTDFQGKGLWAKKIGGAENSYGYSSSLLMAEHRLIVQYDNEKAQVLHCLDPVTGRTLWKKNRKSAISWASPAYIETDQGRFVVVVTSKTVEAFRLETGKLAWKVGCMDGEVAPSVAFSKTMVFAACDNACAVAIDLTSGKVAWKDEEVVLPDVSSPVAIQSMVFLFASGGTVVCLNGANGKMLWEKDLPQGFYSSALVVENRIIIFDLKGTMLVIQPDKKKLIIQDRLVLGEGVVATPALARGRIWVRGLKNIYCLGKKKD